MASCGKLRPFPALAAGLVSELSPAVGLAGFERFAQGQLITLFSATNYCGTANNAGAILVLGRDLTLYPKLIHPLPPAILEEGAHAGALLRSRRCPEVPRAAAMPVAMLRGPSCCRR